MEDQQAKLHSLSREHGTGRPLSLHSEVAAAAAGAPLSPAMQHLVSSALGDVLYDHDIHGLASVSTCPCLAWPPSGQRALFR